MKTRMDTENAGPTSLVLCPPGTILVSFLSKGERGPLAFQLVPLEEPRETKVLPGQISDLDGV